MTQQEHNDTMKNLRQEFATLWESRLLPSLEGNGVQITDYPMLRDVAWIAFTHGKIPVVDQD